MRPGQLESGPVSDEKTDKGKMTELTEEGIILELKAKSKDELLREAKAKLAEVNKPYA